MTDRYNPLVHEVNATVRMGAHPDGRYVLATEHEKTQAELATMTGAYLRVEAALLEARALLTTDDSGPGSPTAALNRLNRAVRNMTAPPVYTGSITDSIDVPQEQT